MNQIKTHPQIHIIPFDLGCVFIDVLSIDNTKNLVFAKKFITELKAKYENNDEEKKVEITDNLTLTYTGKTITKYKYLNSEIADNAICYARLESGLYCYILSNGVGVFVLADIEGKALIGAEPKLQQMNVTLVSNYQKKITQSSILNRYSGE